MQITRIQIYAFYRPAPMKIAAHSIVIWLVAIILASSPKPIVFAQSSQIRINSFQGGSYKTHIRLENTLLGGISGRNMALGGVNSTLLKDFSGSIRHPAQLARVRQPIVHADFLIPLGIDVSSIMNIDATARKELRKKLKPYDVPGDALEFPEFDVNLEQTNTLGSGGIILPFRFGSLALGYYRPLLLQLDFIGNSFGTLVESAKKTGQNQTIIQFATQVNSRAQLQLSASSYVLSYGFQMANELSVGIGVERISLRSNLNGAADIEGIVVLRQEGASIGTEYEFNDPFDKSIRFDEGEQNTLNQSVNAEYKGQAWKSRLSLAYMINRRWTFDAVISLTRAAELNGFYYTLQNLVPAVDASSLLDGEGTILDVTKLNLAKPTLTTRVESYTSDKVVFSFPSMLSLGTSRAVGQSAFVLNTNLYLGEFAYSFREKYHGIKFNWGARFAADVPGPWFSGPISLILRMFGYKTGNRIQFGLGILRAREVKSGFSYQSNSNERTNESIMIPSISLGKTVRLNRAWKIALVYFSSPATLFKLSATYDLNQDKPNKSSK